MCDGEESRISAIGLWSGGSTLITANAVPFMTSGSPPAPGSPITNSPLAITRRSLATAAAHAVTSSKRTRIEPPPVIIHWSAAQIGTYPAPSPPSIGSNMNGSTYSDDVALVRHILAFHWLQHEDVLGRCSFIRIQLRSLQFCAALKFNDIA